MEQKQLGLLLQELIDKKINLDQSAKILWQLRYYLEQKQGYANDEGVECDREFLADWQNMMERTRLQLDHYLVSNDIKSINIRNL